MTALKLIPSRGINQSSLTLLISGAILAMIAYLASQLMWRSAILNEKGNLARRVSQRDKKA